MTSGGFIERLTNGNKRKDDMTIIMDASSLIRMASLIDAQYVGKSSPDPNPTLLSFLEHLGKLGAKIVIPESVVFESTGHRGDGRKLTRQFEQDIEYPYLRRFFDDVAAGKLQNISIIRTPFADTHLAAMEDISHDFEAFNRYRRENLIGFGDADIVKMYDRSTHDGRTFVFTEDRGLSDILEEATNTHGRPVGVVTALRAAAEIQKTAPIDWLDSRTTVTQLRNSMNSFFSHENARRTEQNNRDIAKGKDPKRRLNAHFREDHTGHSRTAMGEVEFAEALHNMLKAHQRGR